MGNRSKQPPKWIIAGIILFITSGLILAGILFFDAQARAIRESHMEQLSSIANLKIRDITQWRGEHISNIQVSAESLFFREAVLNLIHNPGDIALTDRIIDRLRIPTAYYGYTNSMLVLPDKSILVSIDPRFDRLEPQTLALLQQTAESGEAVFGDIFRSDIDDRVYIDTAAPIKNADQTIAAFLLFRIDPEVYLYPLVQSWPVPSESAETLLIHVEDDAVVYLNTLRHRDDLPLSIRLPLTLTDIPAVQASLGKTGETTGSDYRGIPVVAYILPIPDSPWFMVSKVDLAEVQSEAVHLARFVILLVVFAALFSSALIMVVFNRREQQFYKNLYEAEIARLAALEETRTILYSIGDGVIATDDHGRVTHFNPIAEELTGWKEAEASGRDLSDVFPIINEETRETVDNPVHRVLREGTIVGLANHTLLIKRDGTENPIADSGAPVKDAQGNLHGVVLVFRDQTHERESQRERALLTKAIRSSLDEIYVFESKTLVFRFVNQGALKNLGFSLEEMRRKTPLDIKPEMDKKKFQTILQPLLDQSRPIQVFETVHQRKDGSRYPVEVHLQLHESDGDKLFMAIIQDITQRHQDEEAILKLNNELEQRVIDRTLELVASNKELEAFAYSISHDLRAPLRGIDGWSQALLEDNLDQLDDNGRVYLSRVRNETQRMGALIDNLLELSRVTRIEMSMEEVDLSQLAGSIIARLRERDGDRDVEFSVENNLITHGDQHLLEIMLTNLLDNAWKFTSTRLNARIEFGCNHWDGRQVFFVRDNGVGFNMDYSSKLFGAFQRLHKQTEFPGTGIGLATVQRIIHRHGGAVWPEAKPNEGATFFFTLMEAG
ncbi:MAG: PAS domain S-box protein [Anaerolineaceae bacterium]